MKAAVTVNGAPVFSLLELQEKHRRKNGYRRYQKKDQDQSIQDVRPIQDLPLFVGLIHVHCNDTRGLYQRCEMRRQLLGRAVPKEVLIKSQQGTSSNPFPPENVP